MTSKMWLMLDNLSRKWSVGTNLLKEDVEPLIQEAEKQKWMKDEQITDLGRLVLLSLSIKD